MFLNFNRSLLSEERGIRCIKRNLEIVVNVCKEITIRREKMATKGMKIKVSVSELVLEKSR